MLRALFVFAVSVVLVGCAAPSRYTAFVTDWVSILEPGEANEARSVEACDLPVQDGELIRVRAVYSGVQEYWGLGPDVPCSDTASAGSIELETYELFVRFEDRGAFREIQSLRDGDQALVEVIGTFDSSSEHGYGHLGSNYAKIDAKAFRVIEIRRAGARRRRRASSPGSRRMRRHRHRRASG